MEVHKDMSSIFIKLINRFLEMRTLWKNNLITWTCLLSQKIVFKLKIFIWMLLCKTMQKVFRIFEVFLFFWLCIKESKANLLINLRLKEFSIDQEDSKLNE